MKGRFSTELILQFRLCRFMELFCDEVLRESAGRANRSKPPLSFMQLKERWRDFSERESDNYKQNQQGGANRIQLAGQPGGGGNGNGSGGGNGAQKAGKSGQPKNKAPRAGQQLRGAMARFNGNPVCYHYNNKQRPCTRTPEDGVGCKDTGGRLYAHVCNFEDKNGVMCFQKHTRFSSH